MEIPDDVIFDCDIDRNDFLDKLDKNPYETIKSLIENDSFFPDSPTCLCNAGKYTHFPQFGIRQTVPLAAIYFRCDSCIKLDSIIPLRSSLSYQHKKDYRDRKLILVDIKESMKVDKMYPNILLLDNFTKRFVMAWKLNKIFEDMGLTTICKCYKPVLCNKLGSIVEEEPEELISEYWKNRSDISEQSFKGILFQLCAMILILKKENFSSGSAYITNLGIVKKDNYRMHIYDKYSIKSNYILKMLHSKNDSMMIGDKFLTSSYVYSPLHNNFLKAKKHSLFYNEQNQTIMIKPGMTSYVLFQKQYGMLGSMASILDFYCFLNSLSSLQAFRDKIEKSVWQLLGMNDRPAYLPLLEKDMEYTTFDLLKSIEGIEFPVDGPSILLSSF